jgi:preprotein translocase subunit SecD
MAALLQIVCVSLAGLTCTPQPAADKPGKKPRIRLEFRRAETKPAEGLTEATEAGTGTKVYLHKAPDLTNEDVAEARVADAFGRPAIEFVFTKEGARKMARLTEEHRDKPVALVVDGKVLSAPTVRGKLSTKAMITGRFTKEEAEKVVKALSGK